MARAARPGPFKNHRIMKKLLLLSFLLSVLPGTRAQDTLHTGQSDDLFMDYVRKIYFTDHISFDVVNRKKNVFETDTNVSNGFVYLAKVKDSVTFIYASDRHTSEKMIFERDSLWYLAPRAETWQYMEKGIASVRSSRFSLFIPLDFLTIAYADGKYVPFWKVTEVRGDFAMITLFIDTKPPEISKLETHIEINRKDTMVYRIIYNAIFDAYDDNIFQETILSNIALPETTDLASIGEAYHFPREIRPDAVAKLPGEEEEDDPGSVPITPMKTLNFETIEGAPFNLPEEGLAFLDFWYAGCFPCMKAAPIVEKLHHSYGDRMLFLSINEVDKDKDKILRFQQKMGITCQVLLNPGDPMAYQISNANAYPLFAILDLKNGNYLWYFSGFSENLEEIIENAILESLK
jgi:thiol-disulfide isomerase/thioredoxin